MISKNIKNYMDKQFDESRLMGTCENIYIPESINELVSLVSDFLDTSTPFTIQGGLTSITGASVSFEKSVISTEKLNHITDFDLDNHTVTVEPGVRLSELNEFIQKNDPLYKIGPNPTEPTATIGGLYSTNAKGTNYCKYGSFGENVISISVLLPNLEVKEIARGKNTVEDLNKLLNLDLDNDNLKDTSLYSGLYGIAKNKDVLDIFAGTEGTIGTILSIKLQLVKNIENKYGVFFFFRENKAFEFASYLKNLPELNGLISSLEYFDKNSLRTLQDFKSKSSKLKFIQDINPCFVAALYLELESDNMDEIETNLFAILEEFFNYGGQEEDTWAGVGEDEIQKFSLLRHSLPEAINTIIEENRREFPSLTKVCTDFKLDDNFEALFKMYKDIENKNISYCLFGHIFDNHLHLNFMPKNQEELNLANSIIESLAEFVAKNNGCLAFENGIGKLKKDLVKKYIDKETFSLAKAVKEKVDNKNLFSRGNIF